MVIVAPFCLLALFLVWLVVRLVWDIPFWWFAGGYVAAAVLLFWRPLQAAILTPLLGARRPTADELDMLVPVWAAVAQANHLPADRYVLRVLPSDELNAFACGGHLVVVTSFALEELPTRELTGVLAHELSHHLGFHTVALTLDHWLSLPVVAMARFGFWLHNVATAATDTFARDSAGLTFVGTVVAGVLQGAVVPVLRRSAGRRRARQRGRPPLGAPGRPAGRADGLRPPPGRRAPPGDGMGGRHHAFGWRARLAASHPPARTRVARIEALLRHPAIDGEEPLDRRVPTVTRRGPPDPNASRQIKR